MTQSDDHEPSSISMSPATSDELTLETSVLENDYVNSASHVMVSFWRRKFEEAREKNHQLAEDVALRTSAYHTLRNDAIECLENERNSLTLYHQSKYNILHNYYSSRIRRIYHAVTTNTISKKITKMKPGTDHGCANYTICIVPECEFNADHEDGSFCALHSDVHDLMRHEAMTLEDLQP